MQRSFCLYIHKVQPLLYPTVYTTAWGICFSVHFYDGVCRCQLYDERDKSLRFSCIYNQAQIINADFGRLIGKETCQNHEKVFISFGCSCPIICIL